jgi:hypothetical protein
MPGHGSPAHPAGHDGRPAERFHPFFPDRRGPAARRIEDDADVVDVIALLREQYDRAVSPSSPAGSARSPAGR